MSAYLCIGGRGSSPQHLPVILRGLHHRLCPIQLAAQRPQNHRPHRDPLVKPPYVKCSFTIMPMPFESPAQMNILPCVHDLHIMVAVAVLPEQYLSQLSECLHPLQRHVGQTTKKVPGVYEAVACGRVTASTHHPWYTTDTSFKEFDQMRQQMEPLLYQYGVDVFFNGASRPRSVPLT